jgi:hypothetical protein
MMRMAGIPARIVTGYMGGWNSPLGQYVLVRQSDAHAWTEVWLPEKGWTRVDPTAAVSPQRVQQGSLSALSAPRYVLDYAWLRRMKNSVDIIQQRWNEWVIEYGHLRQAELFSPFGIKRMEPAMLVTALFAVVVVVSIVLLPIVLRIRGPARSDPIARAWRMFLKRLSRLGVAQRPCDGAVEFAAAAGTQLPAVADDIREIADLYTRCRYAPNPPAVQDLRQAIRKFQPKKWALDVK